MVVRVCALSFVMEYDIHTLLDALTLGATVWVVYTMRMKLRHTYQADLDNIYSYYVVRSVGVASPLCMSVL